MRHAGTSATRAAQVPLDEPAAGPLPDLRRWAGPRGAVVTSPARRCRVDGAAIEPLLGPWDLGSWAGLPLSDVPDLTAWTADPAFDGHGGESLLALLARARALLDRWHERSGRLVAVTHAAVVRAVLVSVLRAPPDAFWALDVSPGSATELHPAGAGWRVVQVNCPAPS